MIEVKKISNVFSPENLETAKNLVKKFLEEREGNYELGFFRYGIHNPEFFRAFHQKEFLELAKGLWGDVKPSYCYLSMYQNEKSTCPLHTDRPPCKYSIDLCISQGEPWEIFVNDIPYLLEENEALVYSGTDHPHYRNQIKKGNYCNLVFFHFVPSDFVGQLN